eukprot:7391544-Prymnesium_polylepis.5
MLCVNPVQACHTSFAHVRFCALRTGLSSGNGDDLGDFGGARWRSLVSVRFGQDGGQLTAGWHGKHRERIARSRPRRTAIGRALATAHSS